MFDEKKGSLQNITDNFGRFRRSQLAQWVWAGHDKPTQELFLTFMQQCGICFTWRGERGGEPEYIAPDLLPESASDSGKAILAKWGTHVEAQGRRHYPFLSHGLLRTLMAKVGAKAGIAADYWRDGFTFFDAATQSNAKVWQAWDAGADGEPGWSGRIEVATRDGEAALLLARVLAVVDEQAVLFGAKPEADAAETDERRIARRRDSGMPDRHDSDHREAAAVLRPTLAPAKGPEICVSYAWGDDQTPEGRAREAEVDRICDAAALMGREIIRDKEAMRNGDGINEFIRRVGRAERVCIFLSEDYLRRYYCMLELMEVWKWSRQDRVEFDARTRVYVMPGVTIANELLREKYVEFWVREYADYNALAGRRGLGGVSIPGLVVGHHIGKFVTHTPDILAEVQDRLQPRDFDQFVKYFLSDLP